LNTATWTWNKLWTASSEKLKRSSHTLDVVSIDGEESLIVFGGSTPTSFLNDVMTFQFRGHEVGASEESVDAVVRSTKGQSPSPRSFASSVVVGSKLFIFGGWTTDKKSFKEAYALNDLFVLDTVTWSWLEVPVQVPSPLPTARFGQSFTLLPSLGSQSVILFGGCDGVSQMFNEVYLVKLPIVDFTSVDDGSSSSGSGGGLLEGDSVVGTAGSVKLPVAGDEERISTHSVPDHPLGEAFQLASWLKERGLEMYTRSFFELGATSLIIMKEMSEADMDSIGMKPLHKRKLIKELSLI
jgi:hypothetical protein